MKRFLFLLILIPQLVFCQEAFQKIYSHCGNSVAFNIHEISNGYIIVGRKLQGTCLSLIKIDFLGNEISSIEYPIRDSFQLSLRNDASIIDKFGNLVVVAPYADIYQRDSLFEDIQIMKFDTSTLDTIWTKLFETKTHESRVYIHETSNGYLAMFEKQYTYWDDQQQLRTEKIRPNFMEFDYEGNLIKEKELQTWYKNLKPGKFEIFPNKKIVLTSDASNNWQYETFLELVDSNLNRNWNIPINSIDLDHAQDLSISNDSETIYVGSWNNELIEPHGWLSNGKIYAYDTNGELQWEQSLLAVSGYNIKEVITLSNNQIVCIGFQNRSTDIPATYARISKLEPDGTIIWDNRYYFSNEKPASTYFYDVIETKDGGLLAVGGFNSTFSSELNTWAVKVDEDGCINSDCESNVLPALQVSSSVDNVSLENSITITPNPNSGNFKISTGNYFNKFKLSIFSINGQLVFEENEFESTQEILFPKHLSGIFQVRIITKDGKVILKKLVVD